MDVIKNLQNLPGHLNKAPTESSKTYMPQSLPNWLALLLVLAFLNVSAFARTNSVEIHGEPKLEASSPTLTPIDLLSKQPFRNESAWLLFGVFVVLVLFIVFMWLVLFFKAPERVPDECKQIQRIALALAVMIGASFVPGEMLLTGVLHLSENSVIEVRALTAFAAMALCLFVTKPERDGWFELFRDTLKEGGLLYEWLKKDGILHDCMKRLGMLYAGIWQLFFNVAPFVIQGEFSVADESFVALIASQKKSNERFEKDELRFAIDYPDKYVALENGELLGASGSAAKLRKDFPGKAVIVKKVMHLDSASPYGGALAVGLLRPKRGH